MRSARRRPSASERVIIGLGSRHACLLVSQLPLESKLMASEYVGTRRDGSVQTRVGENSIMDSTTDHQPFGLFFPI